MSNWIRSPNQKTNRNSFSKICHEKNARKSESKGKPQAQLKGKRLRTEELRNLLADRSKDQIRPKNRHRSYLKRTRTSTNEPRIKEQQELFFQKDLDNKNNENNRRKSTYTLVRKMSCEGRKGLNKKEKVQVKVPGKKKLAKEFYFESVFSGNDGQTVLYDHFKKDLIGNSLNGVPKN